MKLSKWRKHLDVVANVVVIGTCLLVCTIFAVHAVEARRARLGLAATADVVPVGTVLKSDEAVQFASADFTVLVGLSTTCHYCQESMPAFRQLNDAVRSLGNDRIHIVALSAQPADVVARYLRDNQLPLFRATNVQPASDFARLVRVTPSVLIVDHHGRVLRTWAGLLTSSRLDELLKQLDATGRHG